MRQAPSYLIIGNGRMARHTACYLDLLGVSYQQWKRGGSANLADMAQKTTHILVLISDDAIENFIQVNLQNTAALKIHFSGALVTDLAYGAHPCMTFGKDLYDKKTYESFSFVIDSDAPEFEKLLPNFKNRHSRLDKNKKEKYHAMCSMAANYSCLLWQKLFNTFENELKISAHDAIPLLEQQTKNLVKDYKTALTGPLMREDNDTLQKHLHALTDDSFQKVYQSFIDAYKKENDT